MNQIRVLVVDMAVLDAEIVGRTVGERPDMTIVGQAAGPAQAGRALAGPGADVLVLSSSGPDALRPYLELMWTHPKLGVIVVDPRDTQGVLRELRLVERVAPASVGWTEHLVNAVRAAVRTAQD